MPEKMKKSLAYVLSGDKMLYEVNVNIGKPYIYSLVTEDDIVVNAKHDQSLTFLSGETNVEFLCDLMMAYAENRYKFNLAQQKMGLEDIMPEQAAAITFTTDGKIVMGGITLEFNDSGDINGWQVFKKDELVAEGQFSELIVYPTDTTLGRSVQSELEARGEKALATNNKNLGNELDCSNHNKRFETAIVKEQPSGKANIKCDLPDHLL